MRMPHFFLLFLLLPFFALTQRTSLDLVSGLELSYRSLHANDVSTVISIRSAEEARLSTRFGFNFNYRLSERVWLKTGLRLVNIGYQSTREGLIFASDIDLLSSIVDPANLPNVLKHEYIYQYVEVPFGVRYTSKPKKWQSFIEVGIAPHIFQALSLKWTTDSEPKPGRRNITDQDFAKINWATYAAFGVQYACSQDIQLFVQPSFRYYWTKTMMNTPVQERLFSGGLELGLRKML